MNEETTRNDETTRDLEQELRVALQREAAPLDFAIKLMAKIVTPLPFPGGKPKSQVWLWRRPATLALAATLAAMAIIPAVVDYRHREEVRGLKAKQDLLTALAITRDQLQHARERVRHTTRIIQ